MESFSKHLKAGLKKKESLREIESNKAVEFALFFTKLEMERIASVNTEGVNLVHR